jgi:hypothetical protein
MNLRSPSWSSLDSLLGLSAHIKTPSVLNAEITEFDDS